MNFYYDPIMGLQYNDIPFSFYIIDINAIPVDLEFDVKKWMKYINQIGIQFVEPKSVNRVEIFQQITNYML